VTFNFPNLNYTAATYSGLYFDPANLSVASAGYFNLVLADDGSFSGSLLNGVTTSTFDSAFNATYSDIPVTFTSSGGTDYGLTLWMTNGYITGTVENTKAGSSFATVPVTAYQTYNAPQTNYNVVVLGSDDVSQPGPVGDSIIGLTVSGGGAVSKTAATGLLADGSTIPTVAANQMCADGSYPLYAIPSAPANTAAIFGWLQFTTNGSNVELSTNSTIYWLAGNNHAAPYATGFTNITGAVGSTYDSTTANIQATMFPYAYAWVVLGDMDGGVGAESPIINLVSIPAAAGTLTEADAETDVLTLTVTPATGIISGSTTTPALTIHGLLLPSMGEGIGYFTHAGVSGEFLLIPVAQ
jgi:archaellin